MANRLPQFVKRDLSKLDPDFEVVRVIKDRYPRIVLQVRINGNNCLVKAIQNRVPWKRAGRYFRFHKEKFIYNQLREIPFQDFRFPKVKHQGKTFIVTEYVQNNPYQVKDAVYYERAMKGLVEFNTCDFPHKKQGGLGWFWEKTNRWKFAKSAKTLRILLYGFFTRWNIPPRTFLQAASFWKKAMGETRKLPKPIVEHRDIFHGNILRLKDGQVCFIDFEKMGVEKRWVLFDALRVAQADPLFKEETGTGEDGKPKKGLPQFYAPVITSYWEDLLERRPEIDPENNHFIVQLKFCLLGWTLFKLVKEKHDRETNNALIRFMDTVILGPDSFFDEWFQNLPSPGHSEFP